MKSITITQTKVRTGTRWQVRWTDAQDKVHRKFFAAKQDADTCAATLRGDRVSIDRRILSLPTDESEQMLAFWSEVKRRGIDVWALLTAAPQPTQTSQTLEAAIAALLAAKTAAGKSPDYITHLRQACNRFARGREQQPIHQITAADFEAYLSTFQPNSRPTIRTRISALLSFAVHRGWIVANPCARLERQTIVRQNPQILTVAETAACLRWLSENPRCLAWFTLTALAGLRPEEAQRTQWNAINLDEGFVRVEAQTSKKRQRRIV